MATALLRFTQGLNTDAAGKAVLGAFGDLSLVTVTNGNNAGVTSWKIYLLDAPPDSTTFPPINQPQILAQGVNGTPTVGFTPDVAGTYRLMLEVSDGSSTDRDIRCFGIPDGRGFVRPPYQQNPDPLPTALPGLITLDPRPIKPDEQNYGSNVRGWAGNGNVGQLDAFLRQYEDLPPHDVTTTPFTAGADGLPLYAVNVAGSPVFNLPLSPRTGFVVRVLCTGDLVTVVPQGSGSSVGGAPSKTLVRLEGAAFVHKGANVWLVWSTTGSNLPGTWHVDSFGAVALPFGSDQGQDAIALRTANTAAWNAAIATVVSAGGGLLLASPGIYLTNGLVGMDSNLDLNLNLIIQGSSAFTLLSSNNFNQSTMGFRTTGGNLRGLVINDLVINNGREGLSLAWVAYSTFNRIWFWGSKNFALQNEAGTGNVFDECRWNESAQGIRTGTFSDAVLFVSCVDRITHADFGEFSGGIILNGGVSVISDSLFFDCKYRGSDYFSYVGGIDVSIHATFLPLTAGIIVWDGAAVLAHNTGSFSDRFLLAFRAYDITVSGRYQTATSDTSFVGFIEVFTGGGIQLALNVDTATFVWLGGNGGFFIKDTDNVAHDWAIRALLEVYAGSTVTPLSTSAPSLLNRRFERNLVELSTFDRFLPDQQVPQLGAWLRLPEGTTVGSRYSTVPDHIVNSPAVQSVSLRRPVFSVVNGFPTATFSAGSSTSLSWPLGAGNNQTDKAGFACWVRQPVGGLERIISIGGGTGSASGQKLFIAFDSSQRIVVGLYSSDTGGRQGSTSPGAFVAGDWLFVRWAFDSSLGAENLCSKLYVNEVLQTLTFSDIGTGGAVTTLRAVTGNAIIGNFNNDATPLQALNGSIGANLYSLAGDVSAANGIALMNYQPPTPVGVSAITQGIALRGPSASRPPGTWHVEDFGAVARPITYDGSLVSEAERTANVAAFQAAFATALGNIISLATDGGGLILMGPGIYYTNDWVGYDLSVDLNVSVTLQGTGQISGIFSNNHTASILKFSTTGGNIRDILVQDIHLHGGREGLQLYWCAYSRFNRIWFWGSKNFALQDQVGSNNVFDQCRFDECAQGISDGVLADAVLMEGCEDRMTGCNFGEFCGGIVVNNGYNSIQNSLFHDCLLRRAVFYNYGTGVESAINGGVNLTRPASITLSGGYCSIVGCTGDTYARFVQMFRGVELIMSACRIQAGPGFSAFIDVWPDGVIYPSIDPALNVTGCTFMLNTFTGALVSDLESSLHDCVLDGVQVIVNPGGAMTPLSTSAPALLNPNFQNNLVNVRTYSRFGTELVPQVSADLRFTYGTVTGIGYSNVPDKLSGNAAVQSVDARRPVNGLSNGLPISTFTAANNSSLSWPLNAGNNQTTQTGFACWVKQPVSGGPECLISIGTGTGGADHQKLVIELDTSQRVTIMLFASDAGGRFGQTANGTFIADTWFFLRWAYDSSQLTEALRSKLYINEVLQTQTFGDIGTGGVPTTLQVATGNAIIGNSDDSGSSSQGFNGSIGAHFYCLAGDLSAADGAGLMTLQAPVAA